jgi:serine/threonine-protein kinase
MPLEDGETFAGYTIVQWLGSGSVGDVYLAENPRSPDHGPRRVALSPIRGSISGPDVLRSIRP